MAYYRSIIVVCALWLLMPQQLLAAPSASCQNKLLSTLDIFICRDGGVRALDSELDDLFAVSIEDMDGQDKRIAQRQQQQWLASRSASCGLPEMLLLDQDLLVEKHACVADMYVERLMAVGKNSSSKQARLHGRPQLLNSNNTAFTLINQFSSQEAAKQEFTRLIAAFPFESFSIYPPYNADKTWRIVFAGYTSHARAQSALDLVKAVRMAPTPTIWTIPDATSSSAEWGASATYHADSQIQQGRLANKVIACYKAGVAGDQTMSIYDMFQCANVWVTPHALLRCILGAGCPVQPDTMPGRAIADAMLKEEGLTRESALVLRDKDIPPQPTLSVISECKAAATQGEFLSCAVPKTPGASYEKVRACFDELDEGRRLKCLSAQVPDPNFQSLIGCVAGGQPSSDNLLNCSIDKDLKAKADQMKSCVMNAGSSSHGLECLASALNPQQQATADCVLKAKRNIDAAECLDNLSPDIAKARAVYNCLSDSTPSAGSATERCILSQVGGDAAKIATCATKANKDEIALCLLGDRPEVRTVQRVYQCVSKGVDPYDLLANCTEGAVDAKTSQTLSCLARASGDQGLLAGCAAGAVLPPEAARLVGCASSSRGPTSFALCAAGPVMNEDWRIAAECGVETGGNPIGFAGCTAGRLTIRELTKCFSGEIGKQCFGPNNTIVKFLSDGFNDLLHGPGQNNEIVKAVRAIGELAGGPNSVIRNPGQIAGGPNSLVRNPGQIFGGPHSVFNDPGQVINPLRWRF